MQKPSKLKLYEYKGDYNKDHHSIIAENKNTKRNSWKHPQNLLSATKSLKGAS